MTKYISYGSSPGSMFPSDLFPNPPMIFPVQKTTNDSQILDWVAPQIEPWQLQLIKQVQKTMTAPPGVFPFPINNKQTPTKPDTRNIDQIIQDTIKDLS
jgi:hypothetical protein